MAPDYNSCPSSCSFEVAAAARKCERLKARAVRWAKLCDDLSARAVEMKSLREELEPIGNQHHAAQSLLDDRARELQQREAEIERRWQALESTLQEQIRHEREHPIIPADEVNMLAEFENHATDFNRGATEYFQNMRELANQLDSCDQELCELGKELETVQLLLNYE